MHYMDDWYVLAARVNVYTLIYYCGCNDACCGYAGAVLYTRSPHFEDLSAQDCVFLGSVLAAYIPVCEIGNTCFASKML